MARMLHTLMSASEIVSIQVERELFHGEFRGGFFKKARCYGYVTKDGFIICN